MEKSNPSRKPKRSNLSESRKSLIHQAARLLRAAGGRHSVLVSHKTGLWKAYPEGALLRWNFAARRWETAQSI